jgi:hypothetical protein
MEQQKLANWADLDKKFLNFELDKRVQVTLTHPRLEWVELPTYKDPNKYERKIKFIADVKNLDGQPVNLLLASTSIRLIEKLRKYVEGKEDTQITLSIKRLGVKENTAYDVELISHK